MGTKMQAGVSFNPEVWNEFKEKFKGKASQELEGYMKWRLGHEISDLPDLVSSDGIRSLSFHNPSQWNLSYTENKLQLNNVSYSCSMGGTDVGSDGTSDVAQVYNASAKDIEIE